MLNPSAFPFLEHGLAWPMLSTAWVISCLTISILLSFESRRHKYFALQAMGYGPTKKLVIASIITVLALTPWIPSGQSHLSVAGGVLGIVGEFSTLSVLLASTYLMSRPHKIGSVRLWLPLVIAAIALYYSVLTYTEFDLYRLGYSQAAWPAHSILGSSWPSIAPYVLPATLLVWCLMLPPRISLWVAVCVLAWAFKLQSSSNLWDYLFDLPLAVVAGCKAISIGLLRTNDEASA